MRRSFWCLIGVLALTVTVGAQYYASEAITVDNTSGGVGFSTTLINGDGHPQAQTATCTLETATIRYQIDGTAPTAAVGMLVAIGQTFTLSGNKALRQFRAIRTGGSSGALSCTYSNP